MRKGWGVIRECDNNKQNLFVVFRDTDSLSRLTKTWWRS